MKNYVYNERLNRQTTPKGRYLLFGLLLGLALATGTYYSFIRRSPENKHVLASQQQPNQSGVVGTRSANWKLAIDTASLLSSTNTIRTQQGLKALIANPKLASSASAKCQDMILKDYWAHNDPDGREPWHFIDEAGYKKQAAAENLAYGFTDTSAVIEGWMNSPEHREAILNKGYQDVGFGICQSPNFISHGPQTIVVEHFGLPLP